MTDSEGADIPGDHEHESEPSDVTAQSDWLTRREVVQAM